MGRKARLEAVSVEDFNRRLRKLRKRAKKAARGEGGGNARKALRRMRRLEAAGLKDSCCGKGAENACRCCPRNAAELVLVPLARRLAE